MHRVDIQLSEEHSSYRAVLCFTMRSDIDYVPDQLAEEITNFIGEGAAVECLSVVGIPYDYRISIPHFCDVEAVADFLIEFEKGIHKALEAAKNLKVVKLPFGWR